MDTSQKVLGVVLLGVAILVIVAVSGFGDALDSSEPKSDPDFSCTMAMWDMAYDSWEGSPHWMLTEEQKDLGFDLAVVRNRLIALEGYTDHQAHMAILPYVKEACGS